MNCGILFSIKSFTFTQIFSEILSCVQQDGEWVVDCTWIEEVAPNQPSCLREGVFSFEELNDSLLEDNNILFLRIRRFQSGSAIVQTKSYADFLNSNCSLILICEDVTWFVILSKSEEELDSVFAHACKSDICNKPSYMTEEDAATCCLIPI